jgi:hypothetical protein
MIGKPPKVAWQGIGYDSKAPVSSSALAPAPPAPPRAFSIDALDLESGTEDVNSRKPRPSVGSGGFSDYDVLDDFDGRFESRSTLGRKSGGSGRPLADNTKGPGKDGKKSGFFKRLRKASSQVTNQGDKKQSQQQQQEPDTKKVRNLRSIGSLRQRSSIATSATSKSQDVPEVPSIAPSIISGADDSGWELTLSPVAASAPVTPLSPSANKSLPRPRPHRAASTRRSQSYHGASSAPSSMPASPMASVSTGLDAHSSMPQTPTTPGGADYQAQLANALIAASHAESARGLHSDLLQILNHEGRPWGFAYAGYPHRVQVWYGDRDEKIAENAVRWMERTMGPARCAVHVVKGADHALMYNSGVVIEVLESIYDSWRHV